LIQLDHNATSKPLSEVVAAMVRALEHDWHNPSAVHRAGQEARRAVEHARGAVGLLIGAPAKQIVFTSGGTESLNLAISGLLEGYRAGLAGGAATNVVTTTIEHAAVRELCEQLEASTEARTGPRAQSRTEVRRASVGRSGVIAAAAVAELIDERTAVVCAQWCNNETGMISPIAEIARVCRERGVPLVCDATQWVGKMPTRIVAPDAAAGEAARIGDFAGDVLTFAPHKFHGPKGVGVMWVRPGTRVVPQMRGTQELGRRGGTENVPGIVGCGVACELAGAWLADASERARLGALRDEFEREVLARCTPLLAKAAGRSGVVPVSVNGALADSASGGAGGEAGVVSERLWNTTNIAFATLEAEALLLALSERGVMASAGAACSSGSLDPSPVLLAMGVPPELAHGSLRFSLSRFTTQGELAQAAEAIVQCVARLSASSAAL